ncbi:MAG: tRNA (adenosine(37)-N6)-dimethylallyltransferase MiaA [Oscillospiraceae bacterium]|jgi:tRNA dimethylallyltransferase|nr:tRNA (adenosine(37)-N6)-dimethylallyltransferase MiaA [Oscillospiraceae bacterium]
MSAVGMSPLIAITGTNASGKSSVGIALARRFGGEIMSADSRQVYRGFDLCSGKVSGEERSAVPHHLLDLVNVGEPWSVMDWQKAAYACLDGIVLRKRPPFLVGGTGLYADALVKGYSFDETPPDLKLRAELSGLSIGELRRRAELAGADLNALGPSEGSNPRRLIRILERSAGGSYAAPENKPRVKALELGVTWPPEILAKRIGERLEARVREGMIGEVEAYLRQGGSPAHMRELGLEFRFISRYLSGGFSSLGEFKAALATAIRQFAKRQTTWFRRNRNIVWLDMSGDYLKEAEGLAEKFLAQYYAT